MLYANGKDFRRDALIERKVELRRLLDRVSTDSRLRYADHIEGSGVALFQRVCKLDLEGIVAKYKFGPYGPDGNALSTPVQVATAAIHKSLEGPNCSSVTDTKNSSWLARVRTGVRRCRKLKSNPCAERLEGHRSIPGTTLVYSSTMG